MGSKRRALEPAPMPVSKESRRSERQMEKAETPTTDETIKEPAKNKTKRSKAATSEPTDLGTNKELSEMDLKEKLLEVVANNRNKAWLGILMLFEHYNFNHNHLKKALNLYKIDASFSTVQYKDIAPWVGLDPAKMSSDMETFEIHRAGLPIETFDATLTDIEDYNQQYGYPEEHKNEESSSGWFSMYFKKIVALFSGAMFNTPESLLESEATRSGRIEYQYTIAGDISVLFIEVKPKEGTGPERLDFVAQVIAESIACRWMNAQNRYESPILGLLCDGRRLRFFEFSTDNGDAEEDFDARKAIKQIRSICEALYYVFLKGYCIGLEAFWNRSVEQATAENKARESTPKWGNAVTLALTALATAIRAREIYEEEDGEASEPVAVEAVKLLSQRYTIYPSYVISLVVGLLTNIFLTSVDEAPVPVLKKPYIRAHVTRELLVA
ncbi:hypothetical protein V1525DRAFT_389511 [Lipomyces kononenkoae]|uniref:Uncharacterized protein n=1 Tax=Lipomyces kononenkoae TaxID=34357 RepID=A0ACC3SYK4_LIPKO